MIADTSFLVALYIGEDELHEKAFSKFEILTNEDILILDRVLEETFTVITYKKGIRYALNIIEKINKNKNFIIHRLDDNEFMSLTNLALKLNKKISFVDYAIINFFIKNQDSLLCFDEEINRI